MTIVEQLRDAGVVVVPPRRSYGRTDAVAGVDVELTKTGQSMEGKPDLDLIVMPQSGTFYIERSGRVWVLADGPRAGQESAVVWLAAHREDSVRPEQQEALDVLLSVLDGVYGTAAVEVERTDDE